MLDLGLTRLVAVHSDDPFVGWYVAAEFRCGCVSLWWADWTRGWRSRCREHDAGSYPPNPAEQVRDA